MRSGYSGTEIFRKYLWYLLRERGFDVDAVADMQQLKDSLGLTDDEVSARLLTSTRLYGSTVETTVVIRAGLHLLTSDSRGAGKGLLAMSLHLVVTTLLTCCISTLAPWAPERWLSARMKMKCGAARHARGGGSQLTASRRWLPVRMKMSCGSLCSWGRR